MNDQFKHTDEDWFISLLYFMMVDFLLVEKAVALKKSMVNNKMTGDLKKKLNLECWQGKFLLIRIQQIQIDIFLTYGWNATIKPLKIQLF